MFGQITRLFGVQLNDTTENMERSMVGREYNSKRQEKDSCDASSSKKVRVEDKQEGDVSVIVQEKDKDVIDMKAENSVIDETGDCLESGKSGEADTKNVDLKKEISGMKKELATANTELRFLHSSVSSPILCSICKQLPRSLPISSCNKNHKMCKTCSSKISDCPVCSKPLYKESSPLLNALLSSLSRHCTWSSMGCSYQARLEQLEKHEQTCKYQAVFCWGCQSNTPLHTFDQHDPDLACFSFNTVHMSPIKKTMLNAMSKIDGQFPLHDAGDVEWSPLAVRHAGKMFYLRIKRVANRSVWVLYTAAQMLPAHCHQYLATITLSCPARDIMGTTWTYTGPPSSLAMGLDKVLREGNCLVMTDPAMEQLMTIDHDKRGTLFTVRVEIVNNVDN